MTAPRFDLGLARTPVEKHGALWVKRDDRSSALYGGNKVRKLEHFLGEARAQGKSRIVTMGAAGSHQIVATALFGEKHGFAVEAVIVAQPDSEHARHNLAVAIAHGLTPVVSPAWALAPAIFAARRGKGVYAIPLGGSNALGSLGFVSAAEELAAQIAAGAMPSPPDAVVVALGSGGTAAGLAVGLEKAELNSRVVGVAISRPVAFLAHSARSVARRTAKLVGVSGAAAAARIDVDDRFLGRGYAHPTPAGDEATLAAASTGLVLDGTYTAKAFACALALAASGKTVLYWHTLSSAPMPEAPALDARYAPLFR